MDTDKEVGDTAVADGDRITDVKMKSALGNEAFHPYRSAASTLIM